MPYFGNAQIHGRYLDYHLRSLVDHLVWDGIWGGRYLIVRRKRITVLLVTSGSWLVTHYYEGRPSEEARKGGWEAFDLFELLFDSNVKGGGWGRGVCVFVVWVMGPSFPTSCLQVQPTHNCRKEHKILLRHKFRHTPAAHKHDFKRWFDIAKYSKDRRHPPNFCILTSYMKSSVKAQAKLELNWG